MNEWLVDCRVVLDRPGVRRLETPGLPHGIDPMAMRTRICSLTKQIVAAALVSACAHGVDAMAVTSVFPDWGLDPTLTLGHLLSHTSGLAARLSDAQVASYDDGDASLEAIAGDVAAGGQLARPGETWDYCGEGYWLAGAALARLHGATFERAVQDLVLDPAGMVATTFETPVAEQLCPGGEGPAYPRVRRPSGGLWSSGEDLVRLASHLRDHPALLAELGRPRAESDEPGIGYGLGVYTVPGVVMHTGDWSDFHVRYALHAASGELLVLLSRSDVNRAEVDARLLAWVAEFR